MSKKWTQLIVSTEQVLYWILSTLNFFVTLTMELQYIIPKFLGDIIINVPYQLYKVEQKKFIS